MGYVESDPRFDGSGGMLCILSSPNPLSGHTLAGGAVAVYSGVECPDHACMDMEEKSLDDGTHGCADEQYSLYGFRFSLAH